MAMIELESIKTFQSNGEASLGSPRLSGLLAGSLSFADLRETKREGEKFPN